MQRPLIPVLLTVVGVLLAATLALTLERPATAQPAVNTPPPETCPWDLDGSGDVGIDDFLDLLAEWGTDPNGPPDFDGDGVVGINDMMAMLANWGPCLTMLQSQLQTIRSAIELYNEENPAQTYDATTNVFGFWDHLVQGNYLPAEPENHLQNNSSIVSEAPGIGAGWVWANANPGEPWTLNLYAVDENGGWYDGDGDGIPD